MKKLFVSTSAMENVKKIMVVVGVIAVTSLLLGAVSNSAENERDEQYLTVKVVEASGGFLGSFMMIVDENGKEETIELERLVAKKPPFVSNAIKITKTLNNIGEKGYKLVSQSGGGDQFCIYTTYTFVKK